MSKDVPEESPNKYGVFSDDLPQIGKKGSTAAEATAAWDRACALAAEIERKQNAETEEERLERTGRNGLSDVLGLLSQYR